MIESHAEIAAVELLPAVINLVSEGGAMLRAEFHRPEGPRSRNAKVLIDTEIETFLREQLLHLHRCSFIGEETGQTCVAGYDSWVVDPLDGTADFLTGHRGSAISVALVRNGQPILGVVFAPLAPDDRGDLIAWAKGATLTRNGIPIVRRAPKFPITVAMNANVADHARHNYETLPKIRMIGMPSPAYRLALAAVGEVDAAISLVRGLCHWDLAGGHALLVGAGGVLVERAGRPICYSRPTFDGCIGGDADTVSGLAAHGPTRGPREPRRPARPVARIGDAGQLARAQGVLLGQLAGDALGSAVEFRSAADISRCYPSGVTRLTDGGTWNLIAGQPTDDGEMALALARSLVATRGFDAAHVGRAYVRWERSGPFDIGGTTRNGIAAIAAGTPATSDLSQANGALMRVSPIGIFAKGEPALAAKIAAEDARLTHPNAVCQAASAAYAAAIATGIAGGDAEEMWAAADRHAGDGREAYQIRQLLNASRHSAPAEFQLQMGWVLIAFQNAFHHLMRGTPLAEALTATVGRGGDTDTNAAICGALLGALQGREAVPLQWRNAILSCRPVNGRGVRHPRPREYWPDDAMELAEALLAAGREGRGITPKRVTTRGQNHAVSCQPVDQRRLLLQAKLDGYAEAAVLAARVQNFGLADALSLATTALLREFSAHSISHKQLIEIWTNAMKPIYPEQEIRLPRWVH
ncbi:inositol monophosphatase family protein [Paracoccus sp. PAR01]|uniref:inositol monophosphatase family protein n=1 Tax=Paracoccus sp. PAR01 TaxID=2769282 RepID=UPI001CE0D47A|nr:inositol monophosphatase family protein [Paracoccus sp. PAR01]